MRGWVMGGWVMIGWDMRRCVMIGCVVSCSPCACAFGRLFDDGRDLCQIDLNPCFPPLLAIHLLCDPNHHFCCDRSALRECVSRVCY